MPYDLTQHVTGWNATNYDMVQSGGTSLSTANVTLSQDGVLTHSGGGSNADNVVIEIVPTAQYDWQVRSTGTGVTHAQNWSSFADAAAAYNDQSTYGANKTPAMGSTFTNAFELVTTSGHAATGKALRLWHGKNNYGDPGTIDNQYWIVMFNGNKNVISGQYPAGSFLTKLYFQVTCWVDAHVNYLWRLGDGSMGGSKFFIIDYHAGTATQGEWVVNNDQNTRFITAYRHTGSQTAARVERYRSGTGLSGSPDFQYQNAIDLGTPSNPTTAAQWQQRYGPFHYTTPRPSSQETTLDSQGVPDFNAAVAGIYFLRGGKTVIEVELDLANDRGRMWAAHHGSAPRLLCDTALDDTEGGLALFGSRTKSGAWGSGTGWNAVTLSNLIYTATGEQNPNYPTDAYIDYSELIVSQNPIPFPGQLSTTLPGL
jgi:hypothetical protein